MILAQLTGGALSGILIGAIDRLPVSRIPELWTANALAECIDAFAVVVAVRVSRGTARAALVALVVAVAALTGARFLGLPSVLLADAFASLMHGGLLIGAVLTAQAVGVFVGVVFPSLSNGYEVATSVELRA